MIIFDPFARLLKNRAAVLVPRGGKELQLHDNIFEIENVQRFRESLRAERFRQYRSISKFLDGSERSFYGLLIP